MHNDENPTIPGAADAIGALTKLAVEGGVTNVVLLSGRGEPQVIPSEEAVRAARPISSEAYAAVLAPLMPAEEASFLVELFRYVLDGHNAHLTTDVARVLGRPARDFADFVRNAAVSGAWGA